jgi:hypothetical protein
MNRHPYLVGAGLAIVFLLVFWGAIVFQFGGIGNGIRYLRGYNYVLSPTVIDVGEGLRGEKKQVSVMVRNLSFSPIRVIGALTTCNCVNPKEIPVTILPRTTCDFGLTIFLESPTGEVKQRAELLIDDGRMQKSPVVIMGKCPVEKVGKTNE